MSDEKVLKKVELVNLTEIAKLPASYVMHRMTPPTVKPAKLVGPKALEIIKGKPGGSGLVSDLNKRGKLKTITPDPFVSIGYSDPTNGDPWSARNAEISGPNSASVMFCCSDGPNGSWQSSFNMPAKDDALVMIHVSGGNVSGGNGTVCAELDGISLGGHPYNGDDWIVVTVSDLPAGSHTFKILQEHGYFYWLSTQYFRL